MDSQEFAVRLLFVLLLRLHQDELATAADIQNQPKNTLDPAVRPREMIFDTINYLKTWSSKLHSWGKGLSHRSWSTRKNTDGVVEDSNSQTVLGSINDQLQDLVDVATGQCLCHDIRGLSEAIVETRHDTSSTLASMAKTFDDAKADALLLIEASHSGTSAQLQEVASLIDKTTEGISTAMIYSHEKTRDAIEKVMSTVEVLQEDTQTFIENTNLNTAQHLKSMMNNMEKTYERTTNHIQEAITSLEISLNKTVGEMGNYFRDAHGESLNFQSLMTSVVSTASSSLDGVLQSLDDLLEFSKHCHTPFFILKRECMFISFKKLNWFEAREYCLSMGADLATPDEHNLQDILEYLRTNDLTGNQFWVGASDHATPGVFRWLNSKTISRGWITKQQEPDHISSGNDCIYMQVYENSIQGLGDWNCQTDFLFICEKYI